MANVPYTISTYGTTTGILMFPDNYQAMPKTFRPDDATAVTVGSRKVIKAGTIWPANDATAKGIVFHDVDVTDGSATGALLFEASIKTSKIPATPSANAKAALPKITFFGLASTPVETATITGLTAPVKAATPVAKADLTVSVGALTVQSLTWAPADSAFEASTAYTATIVVVPNTAYIIDADLEVTIATATTVTETVAADGLSATIVCTFPATAA